MWCSICFALANIHVMLILHFICTVSPFHLISKCIVETATVVVNCKLLFVVQALHIASVLLYIVLQLRDPGIIPSKISCDIKLKWRPFNNAQSCKVCMIEDLPVGARHCRKCGHCVRDFDHHCWMLGRCVGSGNYRLFLLMIGIEFLVLTFACYWICSWYDWSSHGDDITSAAVLVELILIAVTLLGLIYFWGWLGFLILLHLHLGRKSMRTHQLWSTEDHQRRR